MPNDKYPDLTISVLEFIQHAYKEPLPIANVALPHLPRE